MIDLNDKIKKYRKNNSWFYLFKCHCDKCGKDRGYLIKRLADRLCKSCTGRQSHTNISGETRLKMSISKLGKPARNKGAHATEETRSRISKAKKGSLPHNKGQKLPLDKRIKLSCVNRGIDVEFFDGFKSGKNKLERSKFKDKKLHKTCFELANYACDKCGLRGKELNAHHLDNFSQFPEKRFDINNLVCLCKTCHKQFHAIYGKLTTKEQYIEFKQ